MSQTTGRYTSSSETQLEADLGRVGGLPIGDGEAFCAELDRIVRSNFTGDYWEISFPNRLDASSSRSPLLFAYLASLNLLDAELLFSEVRIRDRFDSGASAPRNIERHHLFPKNYLATMGITDTKLVNTIANMAYIDWPENATISNNNPLSYWGDMTRHINPEQLERQRYWHALPVGWEQLDYATFTERRRNLIARVVHDGFDRLWDNATGPELSSTFADLLSRGESESLEYKSTARWNMYTQQPDKKIEHVITKTVCGFLNAEGGKLLIGVDDNGNVLDLDNDLNTFSNRPNLDSYELFLHQLLDTNLSISTAGIVRVEFEQVSNESVCIVHVTSSGKPVFSKPFQGGNEHSEFWVRVGNATKQLHGEDMVHYQSNHWGWV